MDFRLRRLYITVATAEPRTGGLTTGLGQSPTPGLESGKENNDNKPVLDQYRVEDLSLIVTYPCD